MIEVIALRVILDAGMCIAWILTYTLVLIGTIRYKYPLISPITQLLIASFEFSVFALFLLGGTVCIDYIFLAYTYWSLIEILIIWVMIRRKYIPTNRVWTYLAMLAVCTGIMCYLVTYRGYIFFFSYVNTFIGEIFWLLHVRKNKYPTNKTVLAIFIIKFIGDAISVPVYFGKGSAFISLICILLPILDFIFILQYFMKCKKAKLDT